MFVVRSKYLLRLNKKFTFTKEKFIPVSYILFYFILFFDKSSILFIRRGKELLWPLLTLSYMHLFFRAPVHHWAFGLQLVSPIGTYACITQVISRVLFKSTNRIIDVDTADKHGW